MKRTATLLVAFMLVVGSFAVVPAAAIQASTNAQASPSADSHTSASTAAAATAATTRTNDTSDQSTDHGDVPPGARLSGVVSVQKAEIDGDVESRAFGLKVAKAGTDDAKAEVVAEQLDESQRRVEELEERLETLERARENGSMSRGQYAARAAEVQAELNNVRRMTDETAAVSETLPRDVLEANGVNVTAIETLRRNAANVSGPEVAAVAREIAGQQPARAGDRPRGLGGTDQTAPGDRPDGNRTTVDTGISTPNTDNGTVASGNVSVSSGDGDVETAPS